MRRAVSSPGAQTQTPLALGAYAETLVLPAHIVARNVFHKPESLSYEAAAFLEPLACVLHAWEQVPIRPESCVAIIGNGGQVTQLTSGRWADGDSCGSAPNAVPVKLLST